MAKVTGLAQTTLSVGDASNALQAIINDITSWQMATPRGVQDVTGLDKSAIERLLLLADYSLTLNMVFNPASNAQHDVFKTVPSTSVNRAVALTTNGKSLNMGTAGAGTGAVLFTDYQLARSQAGELTAVAPGVLGNGSVPTWS
jgi:hypothetical protein